MKRLGKKVFVPAVLTGILGLAACSNPASLPAQGNTSNSANTGGKTMYIGVVNPPVIFNPINSSDTASTFLEQFMFDSLLDMDGPLHFVPKLADSFETKDSQTYTIKLNAKAKWTDGTPVLADDVVFTINLIANPKVDTAVGAYIAPLDDLNEKGKLPEGQTSLSSVKKIDDKTVEIRTKQPVDPNMLKEQFGTKLMFLPQHVLKDIAPEKLSQDPFMQKPTVTNGAFKFVKYVKDQHIEFEKNPDYYRGAPKLDKLFAKIMPAPNLTAQLQTGEIQMNVSSGIGKIPVQDYETVKKFPNVRTKEEATIGFQTMMFNTKTITDAKIRQAIAYALDRQLIVDQLLKGTGEVVDGPYTSVNPYLKKDLKTYKHDVEKAKQMLKDAGWDFNRTLQLVVPIGNQVREQSANIIVQNLEQAGVKVKITKYDFPTIMQKGKAGDFDLLLMGFTLTLDPDMTSLYGLGGNYNFMKYNNPQVEQLLQKGKSEPNADKRREIYNQLQEIWQQDMPLITLYSDHDFSAISKQVAAGEPKVFGMLYNVNQWSLTGAN